MHRPDDHRELNHDLQLFATDPLAGSGLPLWLPAGAAVRDELARLAKDLARADGCVDVHTPVLGKRALFERSGHLAKFADDMFPPMRMGSGRVAAPVASADGAGATDELILRPANCPHHALVYAASRHSHRDLPVRLNELAPMFRAERSGVLSGLTRVRQIALDDTHVFCRPNQAGAEAARGLRAALEAQRILGLPVDHVRLSLRDDGDGWLGSPQQWADAERQLRVAGREVLDGLAGPSGGALELVEVAGEAAFYGPKFDLQVRDERGRDETIATVQLDFNQPARFGLSYDGPDGERHPVLMIHRGTVGSMERVVAALVEHYRGRLPFWLAPVQVSVLPVGRDQDGPARALLDDLRSHRLRAEFSADGSLGARIRRARLARHSLLAVIGHREASDGTVQVTDLDTRRTLPSDHFVDLAHTAHRTRLPHLPW